MIARCLNARGVSRVPPVFDQSPCLTIVTRDGTSDRSRSELVPPADTPRARRVLDARIGCIPHPSFDDPELRPAILGPMPEAVAKAARRATVRSSLHPCLATLCDVPPLSAAQEVHLFRKMNCLKYLAVRLRDRIDPAMPLAVDVDELERLLAEAVTVRNLIVEANQRLVLAIARKQVRPGQDLSEWVSDGNVALLRAVETFDFARGNKFSTYATWSVRRGVSRGTHHRPGPSFLSITGFEDQIESAADPLAESHEREEARHHQTETVTRLLARLDDRERRIIADRYGMGGAEKKTLSAVGLELGISKERVRQIEICVRNKLRRYAREGRFELSIA